MFSYCTMFNINSVEVNLGGGGYQEENCCLENWKNASSLGYKSQTVYVVTCSLWYKSSLCTVCHQVCVSPTQLAWHMWGQRSKSETERLSNALPQKANRLTVFSILACTNAYRLVAYRPPSALRLFVRLHSLSVIVSLTENATETSVSQLLPLT